MNITLSDFFPYYPIQKNIQTDIANKKEFLNINTETDQLKPHQKNIARFLSRNTVYDSVLLYHFMGTGKTCASIAAVEQVRSENNNFIQKYKGAIILAKSELLLNNYKNELKFKCLQLHPSHMNFYTFSTFQTFNGQKNYDNYIFVIDEAHRLVIEDEMDVKDKAYETILNTLHKSKHIKKIILSGTPMKDKINDLEKIFNLLFPKEKQFPDYWGSFNIYSQYMIDQSTDTPPKLQEFKEMLYSHVSYLKSEDNEDINIIYQKSKHNPKSVPPFDLLQPYLYMLPYSQNQINELRESTDKSFQLDRRQISLCSKNFKIENIGNLPTTTTTTTAPKKTSIEDYSTKFNFVIKEIEEKKNQLFFIYSNIVVKGIDILERIFKKKSITYIKLTGDSPDKSITKDINKFNAQTIDNITTQVVIGSKKISEGITLKNVQNIFILTPWYNMTEIDQAIARCIRYKSHEHLKTPSKEKIDVNIYILCNFIGDTLPETGDTLPETGDTRQETGDTRQETGDTRQETGDTRQETDDYELADIDRYMYNISAKKDIQIKTIERFIAKHTFDCILNKTQNNKQNKTDKTRECNYDQCVYECADEIDEDSDDIKQLKNNSYHLFFDQYEELLRNIVQQLKIYTDEKTFKISYNTLKEVLQSTFNINDFILCKVLSWIIYNRYLINNTYILHETQLYEKDQYIHYLYMTPYYIANPTPFEDEDEEEKENIFELCEPELEEVNIIKNLPNDAPFYIVNIQKPIILKYQNDKSIEKQPGTYLLMKPTGKGWTHGRLLSTITMDTLTKKIESLIDKESLPPNMVIEIDDITMNVTVRNETITFTHSKHITPNQRRKAMVLLFKKQLNIDPRDPNSNQNILQIFECLPEVRTISQKIHFVLLYYAIENKLYTNIN